MTPGVAWWTPAEALPVVQEAQTWVAHFFYLPRKAEKSAILSLGDSLTNFYTFAVLAR